MRKTRRNKKGVLKSKGSVKKRSTSSAREILPAKSWKLGSFAWNSDGNLVILDPRLARFLRAKARADRELEIGIPAGAVKIERGSDSETVYEPFFDSGSNVLPPRLPVPLTLCGCEVMRFHLAEEGAALHMPLSSTRIRSLPTR